MSDENPYSPPRTDVEGPARSGNDGPGYASEQEPADRMIRLLGLIIDTFLLLLVLLPVYWFGGFFEDAMSGSMSYPKALLWNASGFLIFLVLQGFPLYARGQTWAKWLLDIRIVDLNGRQPEFWRLIVLRYGVQQILSAIPVVNVAFGLANALFIFGEQRRCLHDYIAGTRVINVQRR